MSETSFCLVHMWTGSCVYKDKQRQLKRQLSAIWQESVRAFVQTFQLIIQTVRHKSCGHESARHFLSDVLSLPVPEKELVGVKRFLCCWELGGLTHPEVVHDGDGALELLADLHTDVLVEAGAQRTEWRQWGPVILTGWWRGWWLKKKSPLDYVFIHLYIVSC